jgi:hypothetical protein
VVIGTKISITRRESGGQNVKEEKQWRNFDVEKYLAEGTAAYGKRADSKRWLTS